MNRLNIFSHLKKLSISRAYLLLFSLLSSLIVFILGWIWISNEYAKFNQESKSLRDKFIAEQKEILIRNTKESVDYIEFKKNQSEEIIKENLKINVDQAHAIALHIYNKNKNTLSKLEIQQRIKEAISAFKFNSQKGYVFINTLDGTGILYPRNHEWEGRSLLKFKDINQNQLIPTEISHLKNTDESFIKYKHSKKTPNKHNAYTKISYVKKFKPFNWYMGSFAYADDFLESIQADCIERIKNMKVNDDNYFFIFSKNGTCLLHKQDKYIERNYRTFEEEDDINISRKILFSIGKKKDRYIEYKMPRGEKITYLHNIEDWNWILGSGFQTQSIELEIAETKAKLYDRLIKYSYKIVLLIAFTILIQYLAAKALSNQMNKSINSLNIFFKKASTQSIKIDTEKLNFSDFKKMASTINVMIDTRTKKENELKEAKEMAEKSDRLKSAFLSNMSHEIRTPMNAIVGFSELLQQNELTTENRSEFVGHIINSSNTLLSLINDIIDFSIIESGSIKITYSNFNLKQLFMDLREKFEQLKAINNKYQIELIIPESSRLEETQIYFDALRLKQILTYLIDNAIKFTKQGQVEINYNHDKDSILFWVKDTGIGIPIEKQEYIFERFRQGEENHARRYGGTGIGLSLVKQMIQLLNGNIWLESEPGKGSTFFFRIPLDKGNKKN